MSTANDNALVNPPDRSGILNQMPVVSPDGTMGVIPHEDWPKAEGKGFKRAVFATSPEGKLGVLHPEDAPKAIQQGFQLGQATPQTDAVLKDPRMDESRTGMLKRTVVEPFAQDIETLRNGGVWDNLKAAVSHGLNPLNNPAVKAVGNLVTEGGQKLSDLIASEWEGVPAESTIGKLGKNYLAPAAETAATGVLAPMAQPESIATMGAFKAPVAGTAGRLVRAGTGLSFGVPALRAAVKSGAPAVQAAVQGNTPEAVRLGTQAAFDTAMAAETLGGVAREAPTTAKETTALAANKAPYWLAKRLPESLLTPAKQVSIDVRQAQNRGSNLAAALETAGSAPKSVKAFEDVSVPILDDVRAEAARQGVTEKDFEGRKGYETGQKITQGVRQSYDDAYNALLDPLRGDYAGEAAHRAAAEVVDKMLGDSALMDEIQKGDPSGRNVQALVNLRDSISNVRTVGQLDDMRQTLNRLSGKYEARSEGQQYLSPLTQETLHEGANSIRNALYGEMERLYGGSSTPTEVNQGEVQNPAVQTGVTQDQIRELQRNHGAAIQADDLMKQTARTLSSRESEAAAPPTYWQRIRGGAVPLEIAGRPAMGMTEFLRSVLNMKPPNPGEVFNTRMKRVVEKASPDEGTQFPKGAITPEYVEGRSEGPTESRVPWLALPAPPPTAEQVPWWLPKAKQLGASTRTYGVPEQPVVDRAEQNRTHGPTEIPLGPTGKAGVLKRPFFLKGEISPDREAVNGKPGQAESAAAGQAESAAVSVGHDQNNARPEVDQGAQKEVKSPAQEVTTPPKPAVPESPAKNSQFVKPTARTEGATTTLGIGGQPEAFEIKAKSGAKVTGYVNHQDFPNQRFSDTRGEIFYSETPAAMQRQGIGASLAADALRLMRANGVDTVNLSPTSAGGKALINSMIRRGFIAEKPLQTSATGKAEYEITIDKPRARSNSASPSVPAVRAAVKSQTPPAESPSTPAPGSSEYETLKAKVSQLEQKRSGKGIVGVLGKKAEVAPEKPAPRPALTPELRTLADKLIELDNEQPPAGSKTTPEQWENYRSQAKWTHIYPALAGEVKEGGGYERNRLDAVKSKLAAAGFTGKAPIKELIDARKAELPESAEAPKSPIPAVEAATRTYAPTGTTRRERLERKLEKRQDWADKATATSNASFKKAHDIGDKIPFGQPILVGHHSERHARADAARITSAMSKAVERQHMAEHHTSAAEGIERALDKSIFSDDSNAVQALEKRIAEREAEREKMVKVNKLFRKEDAEGLKSLGYDLAKLKEQVKDHYSWDQQPFAKYELSNLGGRITADRKRLEFVKKQQGRAMEAQDSESGLKMEQHGDYALLTFAEKPDRKVLDALRTAGFRWGQGSWSGKMDKLPAEVKELLDKE